MLNLVKIGLFAEVIAIDPNDSTRKESQHPILTHLLKPQSAKPLNAGVQPKVKSFIDNTVNLNRVRNFCRKKIRRRKIGRTEFSPQLGTNWQTLPIQWFIQ